MNAPGGERVHVLHCICGGAADVDLRCKDLRELLLTRLREVEGQLASSKQRAANSHQDRDAAEAKLAQAEQCESDLMANIDALKACVAGLEDAVAGGHYHHKAYEPLCRECVAAMAALTPPQPMPSIEEVSGSVDPDHLPDFKPAPREQG